MPYVPSFFKRRYARKVSKNRKNFEGLERALVSSRSNLTVYELLAAASFYSFIVFALTVLFFLAIIKFYLSDIVASLLSFSVNEFIRFIIPTVNKLPDIGFNLSVYLESLRHYATQYYVLFALIPGYIAYKLVKYLILSYPFFRSARRRGEIDLYLPHAINMMYGMATGGLNPVEVVREISRLEHLFGELSIEFREIMKNFEVFRKDIFTSIRHVRDTTPSKKLSAFLDSLIVVMQGGGKFSTYLKSKSEEYEEEQEIAFTEVSGFMEILFEIYISIFMIFPMLLLIVLVVSKFVSGEVMEGYLTLMYVLLPVSAVLIVYLARSSLPYAKAGIMEFREIPVLTNVYVVRSGEKRFKVLRVRKLIKSVLRFVLHPYTTPLPYIKIHILLAHLVVYFALGVYFLYKYGYFSLKDYIIPGFVVFLVVTLIVEIKHRIIRSAEEKLPDLFSEIAMLNESGVSIFDGLKLVSKSGTDILSREFQIVSSFSEYGLPITRSIERLTFRIKSDIFAKAIPIAVKALETNSSIKDAFLTVSRYIDSELTFRKRLKSSLMPYVAIVYMSVGIFLFVTYMLISKFLIVFSGMDVEFMGINATFDVEAIKETFMKTIYLVAFLSGMMAGSITELRVTGGLKHALLLTFMCYVAFTYFI